MYAFAPHIFSLQNLVKILSVLALVRRRHASISAGRCWTPSLTANARPVRESDPNYFRKMASSYRVMQNEGFPHRVKELDRSAMR